MLRRVFGPEKRKVVPGGGRKLNYEGFHNLGFSGD
jgi:hypothetical protein